MSLARVDALWIEPEVLRSIGIDPNGATTKAMLILAARYNLDPILGQITVIKPAKGPSRAYITHAGMLAIAHASGQLDGIKVVSERTTEHGWSVEVKVHRKDMSHPFRYRGGCGRNEPIAQQGHGPEMALARAERRALVRAFAIVAEGFGDDPDVSEAAVVETEADRALAAIREQYEQTRGLLSDDERERANAKAREVGLPPRGQWGEAEYERAVSILSDVRLETARLDREWREQARAADDVIEVEIIEPEATM